MSRNWEGYKQSLNFARQDGVYNNTKINERVYAGDQWFHVSKENQLPRITINFTKRIVNFLVSALKGGDLKIQYTLEPFMADEDPERTKRYEAAAEVLTRYLAKQEEQLQIGVIDEDRIKDSLLSGIGLVHFYWDDEYREGNGGFQNIGRVKAEILDATNFFPGNPQLCSIQDQTVIRITYRDEIRNIKAEAKANKLSKEKIEMITPDEDQADDAFDKAQQEVTDSKKATVLVTYEKKGGTIWVTKETQSVEFKKPTDTKHIFFPISGMNGETRKRSIYGTAPVTEIIPNQIYVNTLYAMAMVSAQRTAYPKAIYDATRIGGISNQVGGAIGVQGDVGGAFMYANTGNVSFDVYNLVDNVVSKTKENQGANDALLGNVKPENTSALLVNQQQANVPLETIRRRYYAAKEWDAKILCEFWQHNYVTDRLIVIEDDMGKDVTITLTPEEYNDIKFNTRIDVGAATQYSEVIAINTLGEWLAGGHIEFVELLERFPKNIVPKIQELIDKRMEMMQPVEEGQDINEIQGILSQIQGGAM